tara:strand:+ start:985 stop:1422 length:438 start_codon:yes stop_codon:yes gene_type:complete
MILISHRGNINGSIPERENEPLYIIEALEKSFDVEVDVWWKDDGFWLGHDEPQYQVKEEFLQNIKLWCHAKNIDALNQMIENGKIHCFFHQEDDVTLTSEGYLWTYPGKQLTSNSIAVLPPDKGKLPDTIAGICSDNIASFGNVI